MKEIVEYYFINDGFGIVGVGWICPYCKAGNDFEEICEGEEYKCGVCKITSVSAINTEELC